MKWKASETAMGRSIVTLMSGDESRDYGHYEVIASGPTYVVPSARGRMARPFRHEAEARARVAQDAWKRLHEEMEEMVDLVVQARISLELEEITA